jgi:multidrug efflux pump
MHAVVVHAGLQFLLGRKIDDAAQDVQAAINVANGFLPRNLPYPPVYAKVNPADPPIMTLALTSETLPTPRLSDAADTLLAQRLSQVTGVGRVTVQGNMRPAIRLRADPQRLASYGLSLEDVRSVIASANLAGPKGGLDGPRQASAVMANDQLTTPEQFGQIVLRASPGGQTVRLRDVARVELGAQSYSPQARINGQPATGIGVQLSPTGNALATAKAIRKRLDELSRYFPPGVRPSSRLTAPSSSTSRSAKWSKRSLKR